MARKSLGYTELEWKCPNCGGRNKGREEVCTNCGAPQPADVEFIQPAEETLIKDESALERAAAGPDVHCAYCGARNPAGTAVCTRCGADLVEGKQREHGQVLGAHRDEPAAGVICPFCQSPNPAAATKCQSCGALLPAAQQTPPPPRPRPTPAASRTASSMNWIVIAVIAVVLACIAGAFFMFRPSQELVAEVTGASWERQIVILGLAPVQYEAWEDQIPRDGEIVSCQMELRERSSQPVPGAEEVCGTPYTVDTGSGFGEVVQDCEYLVYDDRCTYTVLEIVPVNTAVLSGTNRRPEWPSPALEPDQQLGEESESYEIFFEVDGERYTYTTSSLEQFERLEPGTEWTLRLNALNGIVGVEPAR